MAKLPGFRPEFRSRYFITQLCVRIALYLVFLQTEQLSATIREMPADQAWRHSYPVTKSYVSSSVLWALVYTVPPATLLPGFLQTGDWLELRQGALASSLSLLVNGLTTNGLKSVVGRPRPDFLARCHSDGLLRPGQPCSGSALLVAEGRRSFPSGHASFCCCLGVFVSLYWVGRLGRPIAARRWCLLAAPPASAALVALSRVCDFHHHWEDVTAGYVIGALSALAGYRCYFPSVLGPDAGMPLRAEDQGG